MCVCVCVCVCVFIYTREKILLSGVIVCDTSNENTFVSM